MVLGDSLWRMVLGVWFCVYGFGRMVWLWVYGLALGVWLLGVWFWAHGFGRRFLGVWF